MVEDTLDDVLDDDELEDDAQEEVDKVLFELTAGTITLLVASNIIIPKNEQDFVYDKTYV